MSCSVWYHGTLQEKVPSILEEGLRSKHFGIDWNSGWPGRLPYHVLGKTRHQATGWAIEGSGAILTLHVPNDEGDEYLTCDGSCEFCHGNESGLIKPLPVRMIADIETV